MTTVPLTVLDDFLDDPDFIRDWALNLQYANDPDGRYPGKRTQCLSEINPHLFDRVNRKVMSLFFEKEVSYICDLSFQLIDGYEGNGWVHQDPDIFTFIVYLSKDSEVNCGTSLYNIKKDKTHLINYELEKNISQARYEHHISKRISPNIQKLKNEYEKSYYKKSIDIKDKFNRLICFSSEQFHSANMLSNNDSPRLTLIGFIRDVSSANLPLIRNKRVTR